MYERIIFKEDCVFLILLKYIKIYIASNESISFFISSYKFAILKKMNKIVVLLSGSVYKCFVEINFLFVE